MSRGVCTISEEYHAARPLYMYTYTPVQKYDTWIITTNICSNLWISLMNLIKYLSRAFITTFVVSIFDILAINLFIALSIILLILFFFFFFKYVFRA